MKTRIIGLIILAVIVFLMGSCGLSNEKQDTENTLFFAGDTMPIQNVADNYSVEDTVRHQIGGKLYGLNFNPTDSITVIKTKHYFNINDSTLYREYHFIVHNRYSHGHNSFEPITLDTIYEADKNYEYFREPYEELVKDLALTHSKHINSSVKDFNGYWIYLKEYNGNYYINDEWSWHSSFLIADSIYTNHYMDGLYPRKILEAIPIKGGGISIVFKDNKEPIKIELLNKSNQIYRLREEGRTYFITPAKAIHNFEIIQYTNNTGDLI